MAIVPFRTSNEPIDRIFDSLLGSMGGTHGGALMRAPETDVVETEDEIRVSSEMPGLKRDDIEIDVENNVLTLRAEKCEARTEGEPQSRYHLAERRYGVFSRSFVLPRDVDPEHIQADFQDGVLTVHIPKSEKARRRRIEVAGDGQSRSGEMRGGSQNPRGEVSSGNRNQNNEMRASNQERQSKGE